MLLKLNWLVFGKLKIETKGRETKSKGKAAQFINKIINFADNCAYARGNTRKNIGKIDTSIMQKKVYNAPCVLRTLPVELENDLLTGSVIKSESNVKATGQQVDSYDFSGTQFNQDWESGSF